MRGPVPASSLCCTILTGSYAQPMPAAEGLTGREPGGSLARLTGGSEAGAAKEAAKLPPEWPYWASAAGTQAVAATTGARAPMIRILPMLWPLLWPLLWPNAATGSAIACGQDWPRKGVGAVPVDTAHSIFGRKRQLTLFARLTGRGQGQTWL